MIKARAQLYGCIRAFFASRDVLEVDTPILSVHATVDRHIESFVTSDGRWLQTSPEFAMKRLLAAGSGPIYQIAHVFRREEAGRHHGPEFTLLEWYRPGWSLPQLMDELEALIRACGASASPCFQRLSYREAFLELAGFDPMSIGLESLRQISLQRLPSVPEQPGADGEDRDFWLDLWMSMRVSPGLGREAPTFLYDFPASQAALARIRPGDPPVAERFELFWRGLELANGFHELSDAAEQRRRFEADRAWRGSRGRAQPPYDAHLVAALAAGLPDSSGLALGLDRLLMLMLGEIKLATTLAFDWERA